MDVEEAGELMVRHAIRRLVVVDGEQGLVESVGATETRLRSETKSWTVPNARLLDDVVTWV